MSMELFQRAVEAGGRILKAEQLVESGGLADPEHGIGYLLTFDVGRILVLPDREHACLVLRRVESEAEVAEVKLASLVEEEPWWRILGDSLARVWPGGRGEGALSEAGAPDEIRLQFRADDNNPKVVALGYQAGKIRVGETEPHDH